MIRHQVIAALRKVTANFLIGMTPGVPYDFDLEEEPTEQDLISSGSFRISYHQNNKEVGFIDVYRSGRGWYVFESHVDTNLRRSGIASKLYDHADFLVGKVRPQLLDPEINDADISEEALKFWEKRDSGTYKELIEKLDEEGYL